MTSAGAIVFLPREGHERPLLLEKLLFSPACAWLCEALKTYGVEHFLVVCHEDDRTAVEPCFPAGVELICEGSSDANQRLSIFLETHPGKVLVITRPILLAPADCAVQGEGADGLYEIEGAALTQGSDFTDTLRQKGTAALIGRSCLLATTPFGRAGDEALAREFSVRRLLNGGVRIMDPQSVYVDPTVVVGAGTLLLPGVILRGKTVVGKDCELGPNTMISNCVVGDSVSVNASQLNESFVEDGVKIGPFAYVRPHCHIGKGVKVGDFVELKNSTIGADTKISHLTYVGDSDVGSGVNFGCGTVTVNYDGLTKFRTSIGDNAFIGCNTNLVAPVKVGEGAYTAAGSTITDDVPADGLAIARSMQVVKKQWAAKRRK